MSQASGPRKRPVPESSSEESASSAPAVLKSKGGAKRISKKSGGHIPVLMSKAVQMSVLQQSMTNRWWSTRAGPTALASAPAAEVHPHAGNGVPPLIYASDLHRGFEPLVSDSSLAEAASIAETFLSDVSASSGETTPRRGRCCGKCL